MVAHYQVYPEPWRAEEVVTTSREKNKKIQDSSPWGLISDTVSEICMTFYKCKNIRADIINSLQTKLQYGCRGCKLSVAKLIQYNSEVYFHIMLKNRAV